MSSSAWTPVDESNQGQNSAWTPVEEATPAPVTLNATRRQYTGPDLPKLHGSDITMGVPGAFETSNGPINAKDTLKTWAQAANFAMPVMTGGASLPVQMALQGAAGGAATAAEGGSARQIGTSAAIGAAIPAAAEGVGALLNKIPTSARAALMKANAAQNLQRVKDVVGDVPVDIRQSFDAAQEVKRFGETGANPPQVVKKFLKQIQAIQNGKRGPITYSEFRDFYSNASRVSVNDFNSMTKAMQSKLIEFTKAIGAANKDVAQVGGVGAEYDMGMKGYAASSRMAERAELLRELAKKTAIRTGKAAIGGAGTAAGAGAAYEVYKVLNGK